MPKAHQFTLVTSDALSNPDPDPDPEKIGLTRSPCCDGCGNGHGVDGWRGEGGKLAFIKALAYQGHPSLRAFSYQSHPNINWDEISFYRCVQLIM
jgi:hypothetical protein